MSNERERIIITAAAVGVALLLVGSGCAPARPAEQGAPTEQTGTQSASHAFGETVALSVGESAAFADGVTVTLTAINDSRCSPDVVCVWQGELSPVLQIEGGALGSSQEVILGTERGLEGSAGPYSLTASAVELDRLLLTVRKGGSDGIVE